MKIGVVKVLCLNKSHIWESSVSWVMSQNFLNQSDSRILKLAISSDKINESTWFLVCRYGFKNYKKWFLIKVVNCTHLLKKFLMEKFIFGQWDVEVWQPHVIYDYNLQKVLKLPLTFLNALVPGGNKKVTHTSTNVQLNAQCLAAGLFKSMWPFCYHQALKG